MTREEQRAKAAHEYIQSDSVAAGNEVLAFGDFINGAKWADQHPQWTSVEERLPEDGQEVLVWAVTKNLTNINFRAIFYSWRKTSHISPLDKVDDNDFMLYFIGSRHDYSGYHVTHWMPIPPPPVTKGGAS